MTKNAEFTKVFLKVTKQGNNNLQQSNNNVCGKGESDSRLTLYYIQIPTQIVRYIKTNEKRNLFKGNLKIIRN